MIKKNYDGEYYIHIEEYKTLKQLVEHYEHLYIEVKKQKADVVEYIKGLEGDYDLELANCVEYEILRMLGEIDE